MLSTRSRQPCLRQPSDQEGTERCRVCQKKRPSVVAYAHPCNHAQNSVCIIGESNYTVDGVYEFWCGLDQCSDKRELIFETPSDKLYKRQICVLFCVASCTERPDIVGLQCEMNASTSHAFVTSTSHGHTRHRDFMPFCTSYSNLSSALYDSSLEAHLNDHDCNTPNLIF